MPRQKRLNTIYISERLQEKLRPIAHSRLTTVVAPMGYGKTTAVNWYLAQRTETEDAAVIRISVYSDNLAIFWRSVQEAFDHAGVPALRDYDRPADDAGASLLADGLCRALAGARPCYIFIDDFHLLSDRQVAGFLCTLAGRLPENVHLIVAGRDRFLPSEEILRLGGRVCRIGREELCLNYTELSVYAHRCGAELTDQQVEHLLHTSEGWFAAVYLGLQSLTEGGALPDGSPDIYTMFSAAMIEPLPPGRREFLAVMGLADEFTVEMACAVTGDGDVARQLAALTEQNAFVTRLPDGETYRFHHMMKECARRTFRTLPPETQTACLRRYGRWYESHERYLHALSAYQDAADYDGMLRAVERDAGILLASLEPERVLASLDRCPEQALKAHPLALLVLMRSMFNWRRIPRMMALKALLLASIQEHSDMPEAEKGDLLGECDLIMSFLCYNDITEMSRLHRSASARMSRPAVSIRRHGGWTFGSPSVLMMFHRQPGQLDKELTEMDECMPHYYKITDGHGQGAERIMRAEAAFLQGRFVDAQIELERAYAQISGNGAGEHGPVLRFSGVAAVAVYRRRAPLHHGPAASGAAAAAQCLVAEHSGRHRRLLRRVDRRDGGDTPGIPGAPSVVPESAGAGTAHAGDDRKSGLAGAGGLHEGHWPQRRAAGDMRRPALCAGGAARPHPDGGGLRPAGQDPGGPGAAGAGAGRWRDRRLRGALCGELPLLAGAAGGGRLGHGPAGGAAGRGLRGALPYPAAAERGAGGLCRADRPGAGGGAAGGGAYEQPGDRGEAVPLGGQRQAVRQPHLCQAVYRGRHPHQAEASGGYGASLTKG